jgi:hypothetical protein
MEPNTLGIVMPVIRISEQTWNRLKAHATPLEHTPNDIVCMALDVLDAAKGKRTAVSSAPEKIRKPRSRRSNRYSQKEIRVLLLETLYALGSDASTQEIQASIKRVLIPVLTDDDCEIASNGNPRWWNAVCTVRSDLSMEGLLRRDSQRGIWELSKKGRDLFSARAHHVEQLKQKGWGSSRPSTASSFQKRRLPRVNRD